MAVFTGYAQDNGDVLFVEEEEGLTITAITETTQQMEVLTREEIEKYHAPDLAALLQDALDLGVTRYGAYGNDASINLRGFDSERIAFLVDGIPLSSIQGGEFDLNRIDPASIERIEIIHGGSDTKYNVSGALGGVINIVTTKKQKSGLRIGGSIANTGSLPGDSYDRLGKGVDPQWQDLLDAQNISFFAGLGMENLSLTTNVFANRAANHFLYQDYYGISRRKESNEVWDTGLRLSLVRDLAYDAKMIFSGDVYYGDKNMPSSGFSTLAGKQKDFSTAQNIMVDAPRFLHDTLAMEASISHNWHDRNYAPPGGASSRHDEHLITFINRWNWYPMDRLTLAAGWDYRFSYLDSTDMGLRSRHDGGLYLTAELMPGKSFLIIPSAKGIFSGPGSASPVIVVPKLGFLWNLSDDLSIKNNYFRSFKHPDFEDLYWADGGFYRGNPDLKPEDGWGGDLGLSYRYKNYFTLGSSFFVQWTDNSIHWSSGSGGQWRPQNVGEALFLGSENKLAMSPFKDLPLKKSGIFLRDAGVSLSYQFLLGRLLSYGYTWGSDKRIPYMPMHTMGVSLDIPWAVGEKSRAGSVIISGHFETLRYADTANIKKLPPYFLLNININQEINKNLAAFLTARNILNSSYQSFDSYPMPGVTFTMGVKINYEKN